MLSVLSPFTLCLLAALSWIAAAKYKKRRMVKVATEQELQIEIQSAKEAEEHKVLKPRSFSCALMNELSVVMRLCQIPHL